MKFLCDVHISYKIVNHLNSLGFETIHVNDILKKWFTSDAEISKYADENDFIVITKDSDFRNSHYIRKSPKKLIKINLGNTSNTTLIETFTSTIVQLEKLNNEQHFIVEIDKTHIQFNLKV